MVDGFTPLREDEVAPFRTAEVGVGAEGRRTKPGLSFAAAAGLSARRGAGLEGSASFSRDVPFMPGSVRGVFIGAERRSSAAFRLGGGNVGRDKVVGDGVGESPVIDANKSEIGMRGSGEIIANLMATLGF